MGGPEAKRMSKEEGLARFQKIEGAMPEDVFGMQVTPEFIDGLKGAGIKVGLYDDYQMGSQQMFLELLDSSPIQRIMESTKLENPEYDYLETMHRVVVDIFSGQFENNWPEYL